MSLLGTRVLRTEDPGFLSTGEGLEGNFCRCTGPHNIAASVLAAADQLSGPSAGGAVGARA